tara:strand:+ start:3614 stop:3970 length:357 start_codon:yes stop_codon:yes gene_type:complete
MIVNQLDSTIKKLIQGMQALEEECYKSTFSSSVFALDLKVLSGYIRDVESVLNEMIDKEKDNQTSDRIQVMKEVLVVFERKANYFMGNVPSNKDDAALECQRLLNSFEFFIELYQSFK